MVSGNIFIVEDDPIIADLIEWRVRELGYLVCNKVQTGEEAVEYCRQCRPDVVLMDISLRGKTDGIEAARRIKKELKIPIIFLTAYDDEKTLERAKQVGPAAFIKKPFDDNDLRISLNFVL